MFKASPFYQIFPDSALLFSIYINFANVEIFYTPLRTLWASLPHEAEKNTRLIAKNFLLLHRLASFEAKKMVQIPFGHFLA